MVLVSTNVKSFGPLPTLEKASCTYEFEIILSLRVRGHGQKLEHKYVDSSDARAMSKLEIFNVKAEGVLELQNPLYIVVLLAINVSQILESYLPSQKELKLLLRLIQGHQTVKLQTKSKRVIVTF